MSRHTVMDILRITTCQTSCYFSKMRVKFSVTMIPAYWHISAVTGFKNDMLRTKRMKDMEKMMLRIVRSTRPSFGMLKKSSSFCLKKISIVSV